MRYCIDYIADQQRLSAVLCCSANSQPTKINRRTKLVDYIREPLPEAFNLAVKTDYKFFLSYARRQRNGHADLDHEDLLQDALFSFWTNVSAKGMPVTRTDFRKMLLRKIKQKGFDFHRHDGAGTRPPMINASCFLEGNEQYQDLSYFPDANNDPAEHAMGDERIIEFARDLRKVLSKNPNLLESILLMCEGYSPEEIASMQGKSRPCMYERIRTFRKRYFRFRD